MSNNPKTLCIFTPAFPDKYEPNWLPWLQVLIKAMSKNFSDFHITIFSFQYPRTVRQYKWNNIDVIPFNGMHKKKLNRVSIWIRIFISFYRVKRKNNVIGIFSIWCHECALLGKYFGNFFGVKHCCWIVGQDARESNSYVKKIHPKADELVAASDFLQQEFYKNHHIKSKHVIYHGIDADLFDNYNAIKDIDIIGVGSLSIIKQYDLFLEIIAELKKYFLSIKATLCGDGEDKEHLKKMIADLSLKDNVEMTGLLQHKNAIQMMQRAKILLHPSSYEGFGTVCIEALYAGAHVISFVKPLNHEIKNWHIVKTKEEMVKKAWELLNNPDIKYERVLVNSIDKSAKKVIQLFDAS